MARTREQMSEDTKRRLIAAAIELFTERSYENTSVGDLSARAGVTKGGFYHHYASKEDLLLGIQEGAVDRVLDEFEQVLADERSAADTLRELIAIQLRVIVDHREALLASVSERKSLEPKKWALIRKKRNRIEDAIVDTITRGQQSGEFAAGGNPRLLAYGVLGMCYWSNVWFRADRGWSIETIVGEFSALALRGLTGA